jgi:hypothetical protein
MRFKISRLLLLLLGFFVQIPTQIACTSWPGAPTGDDAYQAESATDAIEEEEEEDASREVDL